MSPRLTLSALLGAVLLLPASASAATFTVDPAAAAGCAANVCKTITAANAAVADGDTVTIKAGSYVEPTIVVAKNNVTFAGDPGKVNVLTSTATAGASTFTLGDGSGSGKGTALKGLTVGVPTTGGSAVLVQTTATSIEGSTLVRLGATADSPAYDVVDGGSGITGGTNTIKTSFVVDLQGSADAGAAPAVRGGAETTLLLEDTVVVAGPKAGAGVRFVANDRETTGAMAAIPNRITRGTVIAQNPAANAVDVVSGATSSVPKATSLDSVVLAPGTSAAGLGAASVAGNALLGSTAGNITVTASHVTIAGGAKPFALDAAALSAPFLPPPVGTPAPAVGTITVTADRSIVHGAGASTVTAAAGSTTQTGSSATLTIKDSDTTDATGGTAPATTTVSGTTTKTADAALFRAPAARDYHLLPSAAVVDKGGAQVAGESATDFEGQPRVTGPASDLGADEFVNSPPVVKLTLDKTSIRQGESVTLDASGSSDVDGEALKFVYDFGDGSPVETSTTSRATHQYPKAGAFTVKVAAVDAGGAFGGASAQVTVADATAPTVAFTTPRSGSRIKLFNTKVLRKALAAKGGRKRTQVTTTRTLRKIIFSGTASDDQALRSTELSVRRVSVTRSKAKAGKVVTILTAKAKATPRAAATTCTYLDPTAKKFVARACTKPVFFVVPVAGGKFAYRLTKGVAYRIGAYVITARATDAGGKASPTVDLPFTLR